ncbi:MAG: hypothetical protein JF589_04825, partial [Gemmatimonadetes bacterium]|nr:hypothetical protein [Gemmatimonadota bacterium]
MTIRVGARKNGSLLGCAAFALVVLATSGCAKDAERTAQRRDSIAPRAATPGLPAARESSAAPTTGAAPVAPATPPTSAPATPASPSYTVSEHGIGPLRAGMTFTEADAALGGALLVPAGVDTTGCDYLVWDGGPSGEHVMVDQHHVARDDVDTAGIATAAGARVGDDDARIKRLYPGQVTVTP